MRLVLYSLLAILVCQIGVCIGFGAVAHRTMASIANNYITEKAAKGIEDILKLYKGPNGKQFSSIVELSTYADEIRPSLPWSSAYHYVNLLEGETIYDSSKHCPGPDYCIIASLSNYTQILKDASIKDVTRLGEALVFLVHLMGDVFQPLHVGNLADRGGNDIKLRFSNSWKVNNVRDSNLHALWDTFMLINWMNDESKSEEDAIATFIDYIESDPDTKDKYLFQNPDFHEITKDSREIVNDIYGQTITVYSPLSILYYRHYWPVFKLQIIKSGLQLAKLLNNIFSIRSYNTLLSNMLMADMDVFNGKSIS